MHYSNPIIPGFYPDPSICRVGADYYLVTSTFEYFPGVPIFHSQDLIHWRQLGHCLTRPSQLPLTNAGSSRGIFAPTIRYHAGAFFMITTNVSVGKHFYVSTNDPAGEWSDPIWIEEGGIDPSLFFDDDGSVYFTSSTLSGIYQSQIDIRTGELLTKQRLIWTGTGGRYPESPHLYKINGSYYLMIAEGGTEYGHMITIARSDNPWGPFVACPYNPILTHRNRGSHLIQGTGHGDLVQAHDGSWWIVFLAFRQTEQFRQFHHLGRETFLAPISWDKNDWPHIHQNGTVELEMEAECLLPHPMEPELLRDDFESPSLRHYWNFLRNPHPEDWSLTERSGWLRLKGSNLTLDTVNSPAFIGRRQQHMRCTTTVRLDFSPRDDGDEAGLTALMNDSHHYEIAVGQQDGIHCVLVRRRIGDLSAVVARENLSYTPNTIIELQIQAEPTLYKLGYKMECQDFRTLATGATCYLSSEVAGGFTGVYLGMYATGNGKSASSPADFDWFDYQPI